MFQWWAFLLIDRLRSSHSKCLYEMDWLLQISRWRGMGLMAVCKRICQHWLSVESVAKRWAVSDNSLVGWINKQVSLRFARVVKRNVFGMKGTWRQPEKRCEGVAVHATPLQKYSSRSPCNSGDRLVTSHRSQRYTRMIPRGTKAIPNQRRTKVN